MPCYFSAFVFVARLFNGCAGSIADPDPVGTVPFWSDPDLEVWDRIRILALINDSISTFLVCVKAINT
jgi:hypothetical protein